MELMHYFPSINSCPYIFNPFIVDPFILSVETEEQEIIDIQSDETAHI